MGNARPVKKEDLRAGPNVVGINCDVGSCQASCLDGSTILLAYGFHGRAYDSAGPVSPKCGEGVEWHRQGELRCHDSLSVERDVPDLPVKFFDATRGEARTMRRANLPRGTPT